MENEDRKKYLKKLKIQNTILIIIMIIGAVALVYCVIDNTRFSNYIDSTCSDMNDTKPQIHNEIKAFTEESDSSYSIEWEYEENNYDEEKH